MRNQIILIDDDESFISQLTFSINKSYSKANILCFHSVNQATDYLDSIDPDEGPMFAIIDDRLQGESSGVALSGMLNKLKIDHILLSSDCSVSILKSLKDNKHCINIFEKNIMSLMAFQVIKAIQDAEKNLIQIRQLRRSNDILLAQGLLMSRYSKNRIQSKSILQKASSAQDMEVNMFARKILCEHELITDN